MARNFIYRFSLLLVFLLVFSKHKLFSACSTHVVIKVHVVKGDKVVKNLLNDSQDENPAFKRKYRTKCTEVAVLHIPGLKITQYCKFSEYEVTVSEKTGSIVPYLFCPERGPPLI